MVANQQTSNQPNPEPCPVLPCFTGVAVGLTVGLGVAWFTHFLTKRRNRVVERSKFQAAFSGLLAILEDGAITDSMAVTKSAIEQDRAVAEFKHYLSRGDRKRFAADYEEYRRCRKVMFADEAFGGAPPEEKQKFISALKKLLEYAES
jgi:hypothetical protein